jgi:hypothetical protein
LASLNGGLANGSRGNGRLKKFFQWLTRRTFQDLQMGDPEVADYLSEMLTKFAKTERLYRIKDQSGRPVETVVEMLLEVHSEAPDIHRERDLFQHIGDYLLFMAGLFRDYVESRGFLSYYMQEGPLAYKRVWEVERCLFRPTARIFERLWRAFEFHAGALHYMRKTFFKDPSGGDPVESWRRNVIVLAGE